MFLGAINLYLGPAAEYAFLHTDPARSAVDQNRPAQLALVHFTDLHSKCLALRSAAVNSGAHSKHAKPIVRCLMPGAKIAEDCLWQAAQAFPQQWDWFLRDAETQVSHAQKTL